VACIVVGSDAVCVVVVGGDMVGGIVNGCDVEVIDGDVACVVCPHPLTRGGATV